MQQHVTIGPLRADGRIVGTVVTIEDVTAARPMNELAAQLHGSSGDDEANASATGVASRQVEALTRLMAQNDWRLRRATVTTPGRARR